MDWLTGAYEGALARQFRIVHSLVVQISFRCGNCPGVHFPQPVSGQATVGIFLTFLDLIIIRWLRKRVGGRPVRRVYHSPYHSVDGFNGSQ